MRDKNESGEGRLPDTESRDDLKAPRDISHIDCQEGNMNRGETGGNFSSADNERAEQQEKNPR